MLTFIGLGLSGEQGMTKEASQLLQKADFVYVESYTSPIPSIAINEVDIQEISRTALEDGRKVLSEASQNHVILLCHGDPMIATTHMELRVRAEKLGIHTKVIHNASIYSAIPGETGLHSYKFGRTVTMTRAAPAKNLYVYHSLHANLLNGLHTLILLEYDKGSHFFLDPIEAMKSLLETEREQKKLVFVKESFLIVCSRIGQKNQKVIAGSVESLLKRNFGKPPHALVLPGDLHYTEEEALQQLCKVGSSDIKSNTARVRMPAAEMVTRYVAKTKRALEEARVLAERDGKRFDSLFENVELYTLDAEQFLKGGKFELAILSIGYAEGLLDSLNFTDQLKIVW